MQFVRMIEFQTTRIHEVRALEQVWREVTTATAVTLTRDRDRLNRYVWMVAYASPEHAARDDECPDIQLVTEQLLKLVDGVVFRNLDVMAPEGRC
jgi:hypothetical protein